MPAEAVPVVAAVCAVFSIFIVVVGGVAAWVNLPSSRETAGPPARRHVTSRRRS